MFWSNICNNIFNTTAFLNYLLAPSLCVHNNSENTYVPVQRVPHTISYTLLNTQLEYCRLYNVVALRLCLTESASACWPCVDSNDREEWLLLHSHWPIRWRDGLEITIGCWLYTGCSLWCCMLHLQIFFNDNLLMKSWLEVKMPICPKISLVN